MPRNAAIVALFDDRTTAPCHHRRQQRMAHPEYVQQVQFVQLLPLLLGAVQEGPCRGPEVADVVDQDVDARIRHRQSGSATPATTSGARMSPITTVHRPPASTISRCADSAAPASMSTSTTWPASRRVSTPLTTQGLHRGSLPVGQESFGVVVVVDAAGQFELRGRYPFGAAVRAFSDGPAAVCRPAPLQPPGTPINPDRATNWACSATPEQVGACRPKPPLAPLGCRGYAGVRRAAQQTPSAGSTNRPGRGNPARHHQQRKLPF